MIKNLSFDTADLQDKDRRILHPWEGLEEIGREQRTVIVKGEGIYVYDSEGKRYIDAPGGMWCVNIGHGRREIADAMADQASELAYYGIWNLANAPSAMLAAKLAELSPGDLNHVFFTTGGSTANESALRFVMFYNNLRGRPGKKHIIALENAYHGSTHLTSSCSGKDVATSPFDLETRFIHFLGSPNPSKRPSGMSVEQFCDARIGEFEEKIREIGPERVAAFIAEPVMGAGGVIVPPKGFQRRTHEICRKYDVLYIADEVVTAFGRLGHFFASEEVFGVVPDIISVAKGITSAYVPLGAMLVSGRLLEGFIGENAEATGFYHGFTYSGHPVACAAALKNIELMEQEGILEHVREVGPYFQQRLRELEALPIVADVRGTGLMACLECSIGTGEEETVEIDAKIGKLIDRHCQDLGLIVRPLFNMCVMSPPLIITKAQIDDLVSMLRRGVERTMEDLRTEGILNV